MDRESAIGVFDSGLGGLTAVKELKNILPHENIIYFGDTARVPYGTRSFETIIKYANDDVDFLMRFDIKAILVACGTVSAIALSDLKKKYENPIFGVVDPAAKKACEITEAKRIAVLGTPAAVKNRAYENAIARFGDGISVFPVACPMFVPLVENGYIGRDCTVTKLIAEEYLSQLSDFAPDTVILGCTHYPLLKDIISDSAQKVFGKSVKLVDAGFEAANALYEKLSELDLLSEKKERGEVSFYVSDEVDNFRSVASRFLGENVGNIKKADGIFEDPKGK